MKIKKFLSVLLISAVVMIPSASAFAEENVQLSEFSPASVGVGDSESTAISLILNGEGGVLGGVTYDLFIQNGTEQDWFKWTNTTTGYVRANALIGGFPGNGPTRAAVIIKKDGYGDTGPIYVDQANTSERQNFANLVIAPGSTVYVRVDSPNNPNMSQYHFVFFALPL
ncbi:hypothetical protein HQN87_26840 [Paenibacillus tritici]|uniref:Secreted protein n=1 Tax=Paenibacillus tritici TaxID=1873425 RepID=A0ABX2DZD4_9BACL|nr:hypothetical protein [Paenibacillus tritici]NQX48944.1 hypothetical protein [Paenibacillus tritici]